MPRSQKAAPKREPWAEEVNRVLRSRGLNPVNYETGLYYDRPEPSPKGDRQPPVVVCAIEEVTLEDVNGVAVLTGLRSFIGVSRCSLLDQFSRRRGRTIALARAVERIPPPRHDRQEPLPWRPTPAEAAVDPEPDEPDAAPPSSTRGPAESIGSILKRTDWPF